MNKMKDTGLIVGVVLLIGVIVLVALYVHYHHSTKAENKCKACASCADVGCSNCLLEQITSHPEAMAAWAKKSPEEKIKFLQLMSTYEGGACTKECKK
jgi:hypothetical protein